MQEQGKESLAIQWDDQFALVKQTVETFGYVDVFIHNEGTNQVALLLEGTKKELELIYKVNVFGTLYGIQAAAEQMKQQEGRGL